MLPLLGKPFIEARPVGSRPSTGSSNCFPFWGSPSLRLHQRHPLFVAQFLLLPLLGKPFIEARRISGITIRSFHCFPFWGSPSLRLHRGPGGRGARADCFPFWGSPSLRHDECITGRYPGHQLLPLLGKPFIEASRPAIIFSLRRYCFPFWGSPSLRRHPAPGPPTTARIASPSGEALH